jgi:hypothetical protein
LNEYDVAKAALVIKNILIARRQHMSNYIQKVTDSLTNLISDLSENPSLFVKNPSTDFTRNRKINFKTLIGITMNSGGATMSKELLDYFDFDTMIITVRRSRQSGVARATCPD